MINRVSGGERRGRSVSGSGRRRGSVSVLLILKYRVCHTYGRGSFKLIQDALQELSGDKMLATSFCQEPRAPGSSGPFRRSTMQH